LDQWLELVDGEADAIEVDGPAVPGGLAIKLYPCCYALQRPIAAAVEVRARAAGAGQWAIASEEVRAIRVTTPTSSLKPLIHNAPTTGLEGKFSMQYGIAAALLDGHPDLQSFTDDAVQRPEAQRLTALVELTPTPGGDGLLDGEIEIEITLKGGDQVTSKLKFPPGAPDRPPTDDELGHKLDACAGSRADEIKALTWVTAREALRRWATAPAQTAGAVWSPRD